MTPNPILKVLFTLKRYKVKSLLIGGQACIIYGAAEFSRDSDFVILADEENLRRLKKALKSLKAAPVFLPPLEAGYLEKGHACHFRCGGRELNGLRVDVLSKLRGCDSFDKLWRRRRIIPLEGGRIDVIGLADLVQSKKTQRDKDWLMLKRLVDEDIILHKKNPVRYKVIWWFRECRNAGLLIELAKKYPAIAKKIAEERPVLTSAIIPDEARLKAGISEGESLEREKDVEYWKPLKKELEMMRHMKRPAK